jgi:exonuclease SbcD
LFPAQAHYVALGHVHHPQHIPHAAPTYYAGSLIQVDFGEEQEAKGFHLVTVEPARPAHVEFVPIPCQRPLKVIRCHEHSLQETLEAYRQYPGLLKVVVDLEMPKVGLANKIRKICPQALIIEPCYPHVHAVPQSLERAPADAITEFHRYWRKRMNTTPPSAVLHAFEQLYHELNHETH